LKSKGEKKIGGIIYLLTDPRISSSR